MNNAEKRLVNRAKRADRIRVKIKGTESKPRLCVNRSLKNITAQLVDDSLGNTLVYVCSYSKEVREAIATGNSKTDVCKIVGSLVAKKALEKGITEVVFDRKGFPFHGRVKALAEAAKENGLKF